MTVIPDYIAAHAAVRRWAGDLDDEQEAQFDADMQALIGATIDLARGISGAA